MCGKRRGKGMMWRRCSEQNREMMLRKFGLLARIQEKRLAKHIYECNRATDQKSFKEKPI